MSLLLLNKPYGIPCQFTAPGGGPSLADLVDVPGVYAAGRLDADSEGLVVLTDDGRLQARITEPTHKLPKVYWVQVQPLPMPDIPPMPDMPWAVATAGAVSSALTQTVARTAFLISLYIDIPSLQTCLGSAQTRTVRNRRPRRFRAI